jgi:hypothetical protein
MLTRLLPDGLLVLGTALIIRAIAYWSVPVAVLAASLVLCAAALTMTAPDN